jgi:hypothetical protein
VPVVTAGQLGLNAADELNALKCYGYGADIKVLTFYSDPPGPFTFDVSTYNTIDLFEDKHNNGPLDALVDVWWSIDPIEDRDGDLVPDINVRWEAELGDLCTYQGLPVACGEGDGLGMGGSTDGLPSLTGDNCQDGEDNDGDQTCDITGCVDPTQGPLPPDPDCQVDIDDIEFYVDLPVSAQTVVQRALKLHCKPRSDTEPYTLTLYNEEWPVNPDEPHEFWKDPDPESNFQQLDIDVTCQVADPHYKAYYIKEDEVPVGEYVRLEDQFNPVPVTDVLVGWPVTLMPPAIKYDNATGDYLGGGLAAPHLKCYQIRDMGMPDPDATVNITTQFGTETNVPVGPAVELCVPALKEVTYPDQVPPPPPPVPLEPHYVCYEIPRAPPPPGLNIDLETQFGTELNVEFGTSYYNFLCAPAIKRDNVTGDYLGGNLTDPHLRCYSIELGSDPLHRVNLETQFPYETEVEVNQPLWMCVPAVKEHVCQPTAMPPVDTDGDTFTDDIETYLPTDCLDDCTDGAPHDAWPLDINTDAYISVVGDVLQFRGHIGAGPLDPEWDQRLDLNMDSYLSVVGDVLIFRGNVGTSCT